MLLNVRLVSITEREFNILQGWQSGTPGPVYKSLIPYFNLAEETIPFNLAASENTSPAHRHQALLCLLLLSEGLGSIFRALALGIVQDFESGTLNAAKIDFLGYVQARPWLYFLLNGLQTDDYQKRILDALNSKNTVFNSLPQTPALPPTDQVEKLPEVFRKLFSFDYFAVRLTQDAFDSRGSVSKNAKRILLHAVKTVLHSLELTHPDRMIGSSEFQLSGEDRMSMIQILIGLNHSFQRWTISGI